MITSAFSNKSFNQEKYFINQIEYKHIFDQMMAMHDDLKPRFKYSVDNMQTMAVTIHPLFTILLNSVSLLGVGGKIIHDNACDETFGTEAGEGPHAFLCHRHFKQLGNYKIEHYERCQKMVEEVISFISKDKINVIYSFLICCELASHIFIGLENAMREIGIEDDTYIVIHKQADNLEDGHGIKMLQSLDKNSITIEEINRGIKLFCDLFLDIFDR